MVLKRRHNKRKKKRASLRNTLHLQSITASSCYFDICLPSPPSSPAVVSDCRWLPTVPSESTFSRARAYPSGPTQSTQRLAWSIPPSRRSRAHAADDRCFTAARLRTRTQVRCRFRGTARRLPSTVGPRCSRGCLQTPLAVADANCFCPVRGASALRQDTSSGVSRCEWTRQVIGHLVA